MSDSCPRCGSEEVVHDPRPLIGRIEVICGRCRHEIRQIPIKQDVEWPGWVRGELITVAAGMVS
jgi:transcription initiation factor TFIIIB Brf1 subunit/transcription initiation factor TFIIB